MEDDFSFDESTATTDTAESLSTLRQQEGDLHNELLRQFETTRRKHSESTRQLTDSVQQMSDELEGLSENSKAGFDDLRQTRTTSSNALGATLTASNNNLGQELKAGFTTMTKLLEQLIEKQCGKTQVEPATPAQADLLKREPAEQQDDIKSNASKHLTLQVSPPHSPVKTEAKVAQ